MSDDVLDDLQNLARDAEGWLPPTIEYVSERAIAEIARLKAELQEAKEFLQRFVDCAWTEPSMSGGEKLMGLNSPRYMALRPLARAFLDKAGK